MPIAQVPVPSGWQQAQVLVPSTGSSFCVSYAGGNLLSSTASGTHTKHETAEGRRPSGEHTDGDLDDDSDADANGEETVLVFLHGAGHTSMSWTLPCLEFGKLLGSVASETLMLAPDLPFHGQTRVLPDDRDMSMARLVKELLGCLQAWFALGGRGRAGDAGVGRKPLNMVFVGHSLGGACAIHLARDPGLASIGRVRGLCVVDMVEGAAMQSLGHMHERVQKVPARFDSIEAAIEWSVGAGQMIRNEESAALSVPAQLRKVTGGRRREEGRGGKKERHMESRVMDRMPACLTHTVVIQV
jgi:pimeloyl-ACP methyl ester carboxylesterase